MKLQRATRKKVKLRMLIAAPTGFGKTYGSLLLAYGMTGDWEKIAVIDTENESASLYADLGNYYTIPLAPPYTPEQYIKAIKTCEIAGIEVIIIDSITHVWKGAGGLLEHQQKLGGRYQDWAKTTPMYQAWLDSILQSSAHVICTVRKKQAYALVTENGRNKVEKKGMEDEIRDGFDYEMTLVLEVINEKHMVAASKDRTKLFVDKPDFVITTETGKLIKEWCEEGDTPFQSSSPTMVSDLQKAPILDNEDILEKARLAIYTTETVDDLKELVSKFPENITYNVMVNRAVQEQFKKLNNGQ